MDKDKLGAKQIAVIVVASMILVNIIVFSLLSIFSSFGGSQEGQVQGVYEEVVKDAKVEVVDSLFNNSKAMDKVTRYKLSILGYDATNYPKVEFRFSITNMRGEIVDWAERQHIFIVERGLPYLTDTLTYAGGGEYTITYTSLDLEEPDNMITKIIMDDGKYLGDAQTFYTVEDMNYSYSFDYDNFILPFSSVMPLTMEDIENAKPNPISLIKAEIYARHGMVLESREQKNYFESKPWYYKSRVFTGGYYQLNDIERENIDFLSELEGNGLASAENSTR
ncbi:MAG: YARHG domain-containing protein [Clostridiales bacterium]|jgi:hypothetical protein|nr:YARHG domain-containing protein [Clostridiales bacterium]